MLSWFSLSSSTTIPLSALVLVPFPNSNGSKGWDRGLELLPAARVAVKEINNNPEILAGYNIQLIERSSDACGESVIFDGLSNFIDNALQTTINETKAIAVLGLACSTVVASVSPIAGRDEVSLLQLAMANSDMLRDQIAFPHLWRFLSSSDGYVLAVIELMERFEWNRVGLIFDGNSFFFNAIAETFRDKVKSKNYTLVVDQGVDSTPGLVAAALNLVYSSGVRIIFAPITIPEYAEIMCQAAKRKLIWPGYVWIFPSRSLTELYSGSCDREDLLFHAIENVILIDFQLENQNLDATLVSGHTYEEYKEKCKNESDQLLHEEKFSDLLEHFNYTTENLYANLMYNEVWALALAVNDSLLDLAKQGYYLQDYKYNYSEITTIIEGHLENVSFAGTLGTVKFDRYREVKTKVGIYRVKNKQKVEIATLDDVLLTLLNASLGDIPSDRFVKDYNLLNSALAVIVYIQSVFLFFFTSIMLCSIWILRKQPEVKATSPLLNLLIFVGCYLLIFSSLLLTTRQFVQTLRSNMYELLCYLSDVFANTGMNLITATVLMRLVRVYRIFTNFPQMGKFWNDKPIFFLVITIAVVPNIVTIAGVVFDPKKYLEHKEYMLDQNPPKILVSIQCVSEYENILNSFTIAYAVFLIVLLLIFALLTRKVSNKRFKDTKKVTAFIFLFTLIGTILIPVSNVLKYQGKENDAVVLLSYVHHSVILMSQLFLILPKVIPTSYLRISSHIIRKARRRCDCQ